jgi:hypothetical protein
LKEFRTRPRAQPHPRAARADAFKNAMGRSTTAALRADLVRVCCRRLRAGFDARRCGRRERGKLSGAASRALKGRRQCIEGARDGRVSADGLNRESPRPRGDGGRIATCASAVWWVDVLWACVAASVSCRGDQIARGLRLRRVAVRSSHRRLAAGNSHLNARSSRRIAVASESSMPRPRTSSTAPGAASASYSARSRHRLVRLAGKQGEHRLVASTRQWVARTWRRLHVCEVDSIRNGAKSTGLVVGQRIGPCQRDRPRPDRGGAVRARQRLWRRSFYDA